MLLMNYYFITIIINVTIIINTIQLLTVIYTFIFSLYYNILPFIIVVK